MALYYCIGNTQWLALLCVDGTQSGGVCVIQWDEASHW